MATAGQQTPPSTSERIDLSLNGLGEKKLSFPKEGNAAEVHETILAAFPALGEGYEILRAGEGRSRQLLLIPMPSNGFNNKPVETYTRVVSESGSSNKKDYGIRKRKFKNKKHTERRKKTCKDIRAMKTESNRKYIMNLSNLELTNDQINLLSRGSKFVPTPTTNETALRKQLLTDFKDFARRVQLQFIYHGKDKNIHPFYVKSNWEPPVQQSVTLENYLEEIKIQLAHTPITKAIPNLPLNERKAITELKNNSEINVKKADKGTTTVIMNKLDKTQEGQTLLDDGNNYTPRPPWQGQLSKK